MKSSHWHPPTLLIAACFLFGLSPLQAQEAPAAGSFHVEEATIADVQRAILGHQVTCFQLVKLYLARIKAYNGPGVDQPGGILKPVTFIPHAKGLSALITLNLRPATREAMGFDAHYARSQTDSVDNDPNMPDALEVAAAPGSSVRPNRQAGRAFAWRGDGDQGPI